MKYKKVFFSLDENYNFRLIFLSTFMPKGRNCLPSCCFRSFAFPFLMSFPLATIQVRLRICVCVLVSFLLASFIPHQRPFNLFPLHKNLKLKLKLKPRLGVLAVLSVTRMLCVSNWKGKEQDERRNLKTQLKLK